MKLFKKGHDGGPDSGVTGYWLIEWKSVFSIVLLHFSPGSREAYHSHAFSAVTLWLRGRIREESLAGSSPISGMGPPLVYRPGQFKYTPRNKFHRIIAGPKGAWALSIRGRWRGNWQEYKNERLINLSNGRVEI